MIIKKTKTNLNKHKCVFFEAIDCFYALWFRNQRTKKSSNPYFIRKPQLNLTNTIKNKSKQ